MYSSEPMSEREAKSLSGVADELSVAAQKALNAAQSLTLVTNSETLVNLFKLVKDLADTAKKTELNSHGIEQSSQKIVSSFENLTENINSFLSKVDNIDMSKLDGFCLTFERFADQLSKDISLYKEVTDESSKEIANLNSSLDITKWISVIVGICLFLGGLFLYFGAILPMNKKQQEVVESIGEKSERFQNLLLQRQIDLEHIKKIEALLNQKQKDFEEAIDFIKYLNNYDENTLLINKGRFDNYRNKRNQ